MAVLVWGRGTVVLFSCLLEGVEQQSVSVKLCRPRRLAATSIDVATTSSTTSISR